MFPMMSVNNCVPRGTLHVDICAGAIYSRMHNGGARGYPYSTNINSTLGRYRF